MDDGYLILKRYETAIFSLALLLLIGFFVVQTVFGDTTTALSPIADGGDDSANWKVSSATCDTIDCYLEVDETSGTECNNTSDGDGSSILTQGTSTVQTFDINESSIPNGSTVTQIDISVCFNKSGAGGNIQTRYCLDGSCNNSGTDIVAPTAYTETTQSHVVNFIKTAGSDIEIGGLNVSGSSNISRFSAVITYTPLGTPTPGNGGGDASVETVGGGGNIPARIIFSGEAFSGTTVAINLLGEQYGNVVVSDDVLIGDDGKFFVETISPVEEERLYSLSIKDKDGQIIRSKFFNYNPEFNQIIRQSNVIFAPTIKTNKLGLVRGELLLISGNATPDNIVKVYADGKEIGEIEVENNGSYRVVVDTNDLELQSYDIWAKQIDQESGEVSDESEKNRVKISSFGFSNVDFNGDSLVNINDWSIFLFSWFSQDEDEQKIADLNGDGDINLSDFSVFLKSYQLSD